MDCNPPGSSVLRREYGSELPFLPPGDLSDPGIEPKSLSLQGDSLPSKPPGKPEEYSGGLPFPSPGDLPDSGIEPVPVSPAFTGRFFTTSTIWEAPSFWWLPAIFGLP